MDSWQFHLVDLIKISLPALLVFLTAQYLIKQTIAGYQQSLAGQQKNEQVRICFGCALENHPGGAG